MHQLLFDNQHALELDDLRGYAQRIGSTCRATPRDD
jgi:hypothetical protein